MSRLKITFLLIISIIVLSGCITKKDTKKEKKDFDILLLEAQEMTNKGQYRKAITLLNELLVKYKNTETISVNYNIAFNYYKLKNYDETYRYLEILRLLFQKNTDIDEDFYIENKKYLILADKIEERIEYDKKEMVDPYHYEESNNKNKKIRPKKNDKIDKSDK